MSTTHFYTKLTYHLIIWNKRALKQKIHISIYIRFNKNSETKGVDSLLNMQIKFLPPCRFRGKRKYAKPKHSRVKSHKLHSLLIPLLPRLYNANHWNRLKFVILCHFHIRAPSKTRNTIFITNVKIIYGRSWCAKISTVSRELFISGARLERSDNRNMQRSNLHTVVATDCRTSSP